MLRGSSRSRTGPCTGTRTRVELGRREDLGADCANCFGLCCVALAFSRSSDFPVDKPAGEPCGNLDAEDACTIHQRLRPEGFVGCTVFDCFGAGQKVSRRTFGGVSWREDADVRARMFAVFPLMRRLHELRSEHRDLDTVIARFEGQRADQLQVQRLKKRKLKLKDEIAWLESRLVPDIIA